MEMHHFDAAYDHCCRTRDWNPERDTLRSRTKQVYEILEELASRDDVIAYGELADRVHTDRRRYMSCILDAIGFMENEAGNPPLTVLVVNKKYDETGVPSRGFEELLENLGIRDQYSSVTTEDLYREVRDDVRRHWSKSTA